MSLPDMFSTPPVGRALRSKLSHQENGNEPLLP